MQEYSEVANRAMNYHAHITQNNKQIQAIITTLIGAIACGEEVKVINVDKNELKKVDLTKNIEIFKEANKSVKALEDTFIEKRINSQELLVKFNVDNNLIKEHYLMSPDSFFKEYFELEGDILFELGKSDSFKLLADYSKKNNLNYSILALGQKAMIFYSNQEDLYKLKKFFSKYNNKVNYKTHVFKLSDDFVQFLPYLYKN